ncbi:MULTISPECIES: translocation/assembly module TamB domain-containing protein [Parabacteroides]|uniref:translocation/assembly module TamB domain-containing protein n=1 Tax=Parabacteroides provencensis TaxID=1944636 RepID=UPI000C158546|nr:translocation/assembly module TamB [Parabacteroides provencensis]
MLTLFWIFYAVPAILVSVPFIQKKLSATATSELSALLGVPVKIGKVDIEWFNRLVLENLYLEDQEGKVLFEANHVAAGFEVLPLVEGRFVFTTVRLFGFSVNLSKKTPSDKLNLQFVIDAFASKDTAKKDKNIDLRFNSILIKRGNFSYNVASEDTTPSKFNPKHVNIRNLSAKISLKAFNKDSLNANIKKMSFDESSGFYLDKLSLNIVGNRDSAFINNFEIKLPQTDLKIDRATIDLATVDSISQLINNAPLNLNIAPSQICLKDLSPFVPAFRNFTDTIELSAEASGYINNIDLKRLTLKYSDKMLFIGKMELKNITHPEEAYVFGQVNKMYITTEGLSGLVNNFSKQQVILPAPIVNLGTINFTGEISGFFDNLVAFGKLSSAIGSIQTDLIFGSNKEKNIAAYLKGHIASSELHINELFNEENPYGNTRFDISLDASRPVNGSFSGSIKAKINELDYKKYKYENIQLAGKFQKNGFNGSLEINDPNGALYAEGIFKHQGKNSIFNFTADLQHFRPDSLHLTDKYENPEISLSMNADFTGDNIDNIEGSFTIDNVSFKTTPSSFYLKKLEVTASGHSDDRLLSIKSDILNGEIAGAYSFKTIVPSFMNTFKGYIPALINVTQKKQKTQENNFSLLLTIENTEALSQTLKLPFTVQTPSRITGHYNNIYNKFRIEAFLPKFKIGKSMFESGYLTCENPEDKVDLQLKAINYNAKGLRNYLDLKADAKENRLNTLIGWANNKKRLFKADLSASALFVEEENEKASPTLRTEITVNPSPLTIADSLWHIAPSGITIRDGKINIHNFHVSHNQEYIHLDGIVSNEPLDTLKLDLKQIELSYVFDILNIPVLQFGGKATGKFNINDLYNSRMLNTDLEVQDFSFNQVKLGRLNLFSEWDDAQKGILMLGSIYKNDSTWTDVNGYVFPVGPNDGLSLHFDANDMNIAFLHPFLDKVIKNLQGRAFGNIHLHGPFKALSVEGDAYIQDAGLGIEFLNTYYTFSDSIHLDSKSVNLRNITVLDKFGNTSKVSLKFNHKHFHDFDFQVNVNANKMLMYDVPEKQNPMIYGTVYGSGTATIAGNEKLIDFDINMQSEPKTSVYLDFMNNNSVTDYDFISFVDKKKLPKDTTVLSTDSVKTPLFANDEGAELRMNFLLDITPDANIELIMDPIAGDKIRGNASGSLQIQYGTKSDLRMYGGVNIISGNYNFSLQQIIHKDFKIREGSSIDFRGDPFNANMNINAIYNLTANLADLDQSLVMESPRPSVPVNCVLKLDGMLRTPAISFDLELPGSNEELERQMRSFIDTEDMMTRQIVYLLVLNKFYTPDYSTNTRSSNEFNAVASSAISSQLSGILNSFTDKVQIGANIRAGQEGFNDRNTEMEMLLSSQLLDNRLLINGNFGYKNSYYNTNQKNVFIGEFDLEYKLTKNGEIRLKAYNHANDMYQYLKQSLTTQGVGIMFKKDFTRPSEIFKRRKRLLPPAIPRDSTTISPAPKDSIK